MHIINQDLTKQPNIIAKVSNYDVAPNDPTDAKHANPSSHIRIGLNVDVHTVSICISKYDVQKYVQEYDWVVF